jgi:hypothetical protein
MTVTYESRRQLPTICSSSRRVQVSPPNVLQVDLHFLQVASKPALSSLRSAFELLHSPTTKSFQNTIEIHLAIVDLATPDPIRQATRQ